jgi:hypothetical protein
MGDSSSNGLPRFGREFFDAGETFTTIGRGEIGGKASGLRLIRDEILPLVDGDDFPAFSVVVPTLTVVTTDVFDAFMTQNRLSDVAQSDRPADRISHAFQQAELPAEWVGDLRSLISHVHSPLAVRSSSLLEDALEHPFAGVYETKMIPNHEFDEDARFRRLIEAIKFVYASTYSHQAKEYLRVVGGAPGSERMAVVVQEIVGHHANTRFYPHVSGVARSFNYYPSGSASASEGVVYLALGLGKTIVDGGLCWHYSPSNPKAPPPFNSIDDLLDNTQRSFWAVNMGDPPAPDPMRETEYLTQVDLSVAENDGSLQHLVSTYDPGSDRLHPGAAGAGPRALTFAPILGSRWMPFNDLIVRLLQLAKSALETDVEIEFAMTLDHPVGPPARLGLLQVRPMMVVGGQTEVSDHELDGDHVLLASRNVLGNGHLEDIRDVVYLRREGFDTSLTVEIAAELEQVNRGLVDEGRPYLLIGFGRWGTTDPRCGVPVVWAQIGGARAIVETTLPQVNPDLSQGSHFFHNLLSFKVLYFSLEHDGPFAIDWSWLDSQSAIEESRHVRHVRLTQPLSIRVDGVNGRGVITHHD